MDILLTIFLWLAGIFAFYVLVLAVIFSSIAEKRTASSKRELDTVAWVGSILIIVLVGVGINSLFSLATSPDNEVLIWIFYAFFFGSFFIWLFTPSKKDESSKDEIQKQILNNLMMDKLKKNSK